MNSAEGTERLSINDQAELARFRKALVIIDDAKKQGSSRSAGEQAYSTAIAVRTMATAEQAGNYDHINGAGAWARKLARDAQYEENAKRWAVEREEREKCELAELEAKLALETPEQKTRRERKEERQRAADSRWAYRYWERQRRKAHKDAERRDHAAYHSGGRTAEQIGLDGQLKAGKATSGLR